MNPDYVINQQLLIVVIQLIQSGTYSNVPYANITQVLEALTKLPPITVLRDGPEQEANEPEQTPRNGTSNAKRRRVTG